MPEVNLLSIPQFTPSQTSNRLMTQMMCTRVNHIFSGVGTKKKKVHKTHLRTLKVKTPHISSKKRFHPDNIQHIRNKIATWANISNNWKSLMHCPWGDHLWRYSYQTFTFLNIKTFFRNLPGFKTSDSTRDRHASTQSKVLAGEGWFWFGFEEAWDESTSRTRKFSSSI